MGERVARAVRGSGLGLTYAAAVVGVAAWLATLPAAARAAVVTATSTNADNLRSRPLQVLGASAVVTDSAGALLLLVPLVLGTTVAVRRWGRASALVALALGHVGATLVVGVLVVAGLTHGRLDPGIARADDVGTSYALAGVAGLLAAALPRRWGLAAAAAALAALGGWALLVPSFTAVGHLVALGLGLALAAVAAQAGAAARRGRPASGGTRRSRGAEQLERTCR